MAECPLLDLRAEVFEAGHTNVLVKTDELLLQFRGEGVARLLLALDGSTTLGALTAAHGAARVESVLHRLRQSRLVSWPDDSGHSPAAGAHHDILGNLSPTSGRPLRMVLTESYFRPEFLEDVQLAAQSGIAWAVLKSGVSNVWLGPVFEKGSAPCWNCFLMRLASQDDRWTLLAKCAYRPRVRVTPDLFAHQAAEAAARHINDYVAGAQSALDQSVLLEIDVSSGNTAIHRVIPYPACVNCAGKGGPGKGRRPRTAPAHLWQIVEQRTGHLIDPVTGVVADLGVCNATSDGPVQVAVARYADPTRGKLSEYSFDESTGRLVRSQAVSRKSFGGGKNSSEARGRAVLEAFERYCGIFQPGEATVCASFVELGDAAVHPDRLMNYSAEQLKRPNWSERGTPRELRVPERFNEHARIHWSPIESLSGATKYAPTAFCYDGFDEQPDVSFCTYDTNGSAVAFAIEDAIVHGFLEVVERDAVGIWWYNRITRPAVQLATFRDAFIDRVAAQHLALGRDLTVFDVTNDLGIPVFAAVSAHTDGPLFGFGGHFSPGRALVAALTELGQALCFASQEAKKWISVNWLEQTQLVRDDSREGGVRSASDYACMPEKSTVQRCADAAAAAGLECFVKECSRVEIGLPAVRVIIPGLRHMWPRFGAGRLWDVPVRLGWLNRPRTPGELNPEYLRS